MLENEILFIVEGAVDEPEIIKLINDKLNIGENLNINIYSYQTSIYELYEDLVIDEYLDIVLHLRSKEEDKRQKEMLSKNFQAIYLIFDFEPQYQKFDVNRIIELNNFFNNSLEPGMLLINYPMLESYKHIGKMPDQDFLTKTITKKEVSKYKEIVGAESFYTNHSLYHRSLMMEQIIHHLIKLNYLINNVKTMPKYADIEGLINNEGFIRSQYEAYENNALYVVSTVYYYLIELKPKSFYDELQLPVIDELTIT